MILWADDSFPLAMSAKGRTAVCDIDNNTVRIPAYNPACGIGIFLRRGVAYALFLQFPYIRKGHFCYGVIFGRSPINQRKVVGRNGKTKVFWHSFYFINLFWCQRKKCSKSLYRLDTMSDLPLPVIPVLLGCVQIRQNRFFFAGAAFRFANAATRKAPVPTGGLSPGQFDVVV